jgi:hypothetical protein
MIQQSSLSSVRQKNRFSNASVIITAPDGEGAQIEWSVFHLALV